jgi:hypothetical protein
MRILTSLLLAAFVLALPLAVLAAPHQQSSVDIKTLALTQGDLQRGFAVVPDRTVSDDRPDGVAVYDVTFARERTPENLATGPFEIRSGVARTAKVEDAILQLESTKEAFLGEGWAETGVPALGDETLGLTQTTEGDDGKIAHYSYLFRKGSYIMMIGLRGRPEAVKLNDVVALAITVSGRLDTALGAPAPAGAPPASGTTTRQGSGERVRVIGADGGNVNMRAEPSTSAAVVTQVAEGTTLDIVGPNRDAEDRTWRNVRAGTDTGWIASNFLEMVTPPAPAPAASPSPAPRLPAPDPAAEPTDEGAIEEEPAAVEELPAQEGAPPATPAPSASATPAPAASDTTFRGTGNGLVVEATLREKNLSGGTQMVKVRVTRNGGGVSNAFVDITARLDAKRYRAIKADNTNGDGWTEVEWEMEGPGGNYEVQVDARTDVNGPATTAKGSFRWK